ncbi:MAG: SH3 domain-containing protein [Anaerolineae bacterium]|nr:SH3 domain-containing protein [Anaerolineae bacterium]
MNNLLRSSLIMFAMLWCFTYVTAQSSVDESTVNELLEAGETSVFAGDLLLDEQFGSADAWEVYQDDDISFKVAKGVYRMVYVGDGYTWGLNDEVHSDVIMRVETTQNSDYDNNSYGVMCRADTENNSAGYYFRISGDGYYTISMSDGEETIALVEWTESKVINQGQESNELVAVCVEDYLALYVNGELLAETNDDTFSEGFAGFSVGAYDDGNVDISFDNLLIWEGSEGSAPQIDPQVDPQGSGNTAVILQDFGGDSEDAIKELEQLGVIPSGSVFIFGEDYAFFTGQGNWFQPIASNQARKNIVLAGELTFTVGNTDEFEICSLTSRIITNSRGDATTYVDMGLLNDGSVVIIDRFSETEDLNFGVSPFTVDLDDPHHMLMVMVDDVANVYVDGLLAISNFTVAERAGSYGIALTGRGSDARCEGRDIWAYQVPSATAAGECVVSSGRAVNKRTGPGTNFDQAGQLAAGTEATVIGQATGADGLVWWQLEDENWVREDVVNAVGDCSSVPIVKR